MNEPSTLEWMTKQRDQLKRELDELNPRLDRAEIPLLKLTDRLKNLAEKIEGQERDHAAVIASLKAQADGVSASLEEEKQSRREIAERIESVKGQLAGLESKLTVTELP